MWKGFEDPPHLVFAIKIFLSKFDGEIDSGSGVLDFRFGIASF